MATVEQNRAAWDSAALWTDRGDEWSDAWGGPAAQWGGAILPRIRAYLPAHHLLEIAPGQGRWTQFLAAECDTLTAVDLSPACIAECQRRFHGESRLRFFVNDGQSLAMLPDRSIDFAFSLDSLVHAELPVMRAYLRELARVLVPDGVAFLHHSNLGAFGPPGLARRCLPHAVCMALMVRGFIPNDHWRAYSVTADLVCDAAATAGLSCIRQELVNWGGDRLTDCFSSVTPAESRWARALERISNPAFMAEAAAIRAAARA